MTQPIRIQSREEWQASPPKETIKEQEYQRPLEEVMDYIVIHHTALKAEYPPKNLQDYFFQKKYDDIGYHFYIETDGTISEGRELKYMGGHAGTSREELRDKDFRKDPDYGAIGIALAGCFDDICYHQDEMTLAQKTSLQSLIMYLQGRFTNIGWEDVILHNEVDEKITKKRGLTPYHGPDHTVCPGGTASDYIRKNLLPPECDQPLVK